MTISAGQEWGVEVDSPNGPWVHGGPRELAKHCESGSSAPFALSSGSLYEVVGRPVSAMTTSRCRQLAIDMIDVDLTFRSGHRMRRLATDIVVRASRLRGSDLVGDVVVVSNCGMYRGVEFSVRGHPNDGRLEMLRVSEATPRERLIAFSRAHAHTFAATTAIRVSQTVGESLVVPRGHVVLVDGEMIRDVERVDLTVDEDRASVYIGVQ